MKNIFLIRHGESLANVDRALHANTPDHAIPLSERGHQQAAKAGEALSDLMFGVGLPPDARVRIWTSPYQRTRQTADHVQKAVSKTHANIDRREHIMLCEQQFGLFDGIPDDELPSRFPLEHAHYALAEKFEGRFWARMPMGESRFDVALRVHQSFGTFHRDAERHGIENIIVVAHGVTLRAFAMQWRHLPYEWFEAQKNPGNCDIFHLGESETNDRGYVYRSDRESAPEQMNLRGLA